MNGIVQLLSCKVLPKGQLRFFVFALLLAPLPAAHAQLRTGRASRPLYQAHLSDSSEQPVSIIEPASYVQEADSAAVPEPSVEPIPLEGASPEPAFEPIPMQGEYEDQYAPEQTYMSGSDEMVYFDSGSCDGLGCDGYCGSNCQNCSPFDGSWLLTPATNPYPANGSPLAAFFYRSNFRFEVPLYWRRGQGPPPLVTSSPIGTDIADAGVLGLDTTQVLFGEQAIGNDIKAGFRFTMNTYLGPKNCYAVMLRAWSAGELTEDFLFSSTGNPILARPILNTEVDPPTNEAVSIAFPDTTEGSIRIQTHSMVNGLELSLRRQLYQDRFTRLDWLYGYQHVNIEEGISILSSTTVTAPTPGLQGTQQIIFDQFETQNEFHGMHYGLMSSRKIACMKLETMFRLGLGNLRRQVQIQGTTTDISGNLSETVNEGLLARNTNSQPFVDDTFIVIPEIGINLAYRIRPGVDFNVGYNYLVVPKVGQASQQIDPNLAVNLSDPLQGPLDPALNFDERRYWLHSLGLGLQIRY